MAKPPEARESPARPLGVACRFGFWTFFAARQVGNDRVSVHGKVTIKENEEGHIVPQPGGILYCYVFALAAASHAARHHTRSISLCTSSRDVAALLHPAEHSGLRVDLKKKQYDIVAQHFVHAVAVRPHIATTRPQHPSACRDHKDAD